MLEGLKRALDRFVKGVGKGKIDEKTLERHLEELELLLLSAGTALPAVERIKDVLRERLLGTEGDVQTRVRDALEEILNVPAPSLFPPKEKPSVLLFLGPNGAGKTTTLAKVAYLLMNKGYTCVFSASDTFRAGSVEQLEDWAKRLGVRVIKQGYGADPAAVAYDAVEHARAKGVDYVLVDTAGRQETNENLMEQLRKINRVVRPEMRIFVGEALAGNALLHQISGFDEAVGVDTVILTKFDLDVKGGAAFTVTAGAGKPISYVGTGQELKDLVPFSPSLVLDRIFT